MIDATGERAKFGRYVLDALIGSGGMARVYVGRLEGWAGFSTRVAVKRLHPDLAADPEFAAMLLDEARLTGHIRHPNVVGTIDVVREHGEFLLAMDYVVGVPLDVLLRRCRTSGARIPLGVVAAIVTGILEGLHAAHEASDAEGRPLRIVHRDVSPQNVLVEESGLAKILDFGIATAANRISTTKEGTIKGKPAYIAPEQLEGGAVDARADLFAVGAILWEMLTNERFREDASFARMLDGSERGARAVPVERLPDEEGRRLAEVAAKALAIEPSERYATARAMARAIESVVTPASLTHVGAWCSETAPEILQSRRAVAVALPLASPGEATARTDVSARGGATPPTVASAAGAAAPRSPSEAREPSRPPSSRRPTVVALAVVALTLASASGLVLQRRKESAASLANAERSARPTTEPPSPADASSSAAAASASPPSGTIAPTVAVEPSLAASSTSRASAPPPGSKRSTPVRAAKAPVDCRVPFVVNEAGLKIPKRECL